MLLHLIAFSIRFRGVVIALACLVVGYGVYVTARARYDVYPEFAPPLVVIQTEAPGLSPEEVEALVTRPVENAVNGVGSLESVRSQSIQGLSVVTAIFQEGADVYRARQMVSERLAGVFSEMPQGVKPPRMAPLTSATSMVYVAGLTSGAQSLMDLRTFADWTLRPRLLGVAGVANVAIYGGEVRQLQIQLRPDRLVAFDVTIDEVLAAAREATGIRGAGFVDTGPQRVVLQARGQSLTPEQLGAAALTSHAGTTVRLRDVARVVEAPEPKIGDASIEGQPGVMLAVTAQLGANTAEVTGGIERALEEIKPALQAARIRLHPDLFRPATFIETAIHNIGTSLLAGGILVSVVLFLFLFNLRTAFISLTAIPLSLLAAVIVLDRCGVTLNTLTLGGLAIAIGAVVDDAIIDVENIFRRLRENARLPAPLSAFDVVLEASLEVRSAVVYATFIVALVFLPVLTMSGVQGRLFAPLGIAYILAILASLLVALTLTPALCYAMLSPKAAAADESPLVAKLKDGYRRLLERLAQRPGVVISGVLALCLAALAALPFFGGAFLPELKEGHFIVHMAAPPGTSLEESMRLGLKVSAALKASPYVRVVSQQIGRAELGEDTWGTHYSEFHVALKPLSGEQAESAEPAIRRIVSQFPGVYFAIKPFLTERMEEVMSGVNAQVVIKIFGDNLDTLDRTAGQVAQTVSGIRGAADVQMESPSGMPEMVIRLRPDRLQQFGFRPVAVLEAIQTAYQGAVAGETYEGNRVFDVSVILDENSRRDPERLGSLIVHSPEGLRLPLGELADIFATTGRYMVVHDGAKRRQAVTCNVAGRDVSSFVAQARRQIGNRVQLPQGVYLEFTGAAEARARAQREILLYSLIAAVGIILLLSMVFPNWRNLLLILANIPFALVGGVAAVFATGGWLTVGSLVGFVTLFGITMRNSIMMLSHFDHLVRKEGENWTLATALRGASERLSPVLMTALVTALGLLPLALGSGDPGREVEGPMAIVILGGLATSTALNLLVLPTLALRYGRFETTGALPQTAG